MRPGSIIVLVLLATACHEVGAANVACTEDDQCPPGSVCGTNGFCSAPEDGGSVDSGPEDAGSRDAGSEDAGPQDAGSEDAGLVSFCGRHGDKGNDQGVGEFCLTGADCTGLAKRCSTADHDQALQHTYFCTRSCDSTDGCGHNAYCGCPTASDCLCIPDSCSDIAAPLDAGPSPPVDAGPLPDAGPKDAGGMDAGSNPCLTDNGGCPADTTCQYNGTITCVCTCMTSSGQCADLSNDPMNCGMCGHNCDGDMCCNSQCVDTSSDDDNCGMCGKMCTSPNGNCEGGKCCNALGVCL